MTAVTPYLLGLAAAASTYVGGRIAMRVGRRRDLLFGLTGGMVIGLALLDLLPAAIDGGQVAADVIFGVAALGMAAYILLHRLPGGAGVARASLIAHSLMDGLGIGLAFQLSSATGWLVAIAVLAHDMADGANMVGVSMPAVDRRAAHRWLIVNAAAPLAGVVIGQAIGIDEARLSLLLALFGGGFLYIGAAELLPRSRGGPARYGAGLASVGGIGLMALMIHTTG